MKKANLFQQIILRIKKNKQEASIMVTMFVLLLVSLVIVAKGDMNLKASVLDLGGYGYGHGQVSGYGYGYTNKIFHGISTNYFSIDEVTSEFDNERNALFISVSYSSPNNKIIIPRLHLELLDGTNGGALKIIGGGASDDRTCRTITTADQKCRMSRSFEFGDSVPTSVLPILSADMTIIDGETTIVTKDRGSLGVYPLNGNITPTVSCDSAEVMLACTLGTTNCPAMCKKDNTTGDIVPTIPTTGEIVTVEPVNCNEPLTALSCLMGMSSCPVECKTAETIDKTPRIMMWGGKVNQHINIDNGQRETDPDGESGAGIDILEYCQKWYPATSSTQEYKTETISTWKGAGNVNNYEGTKKSISCIE